MLYKLIRAAHFLPQQPSKYLQLDNVSEHSIVKTVMDCALFEIRNKVLSVGVLNASYTVTGKSVEGTSASGYKSSADRCAALDVHHRPTNRPEFPRVTP